MKRSRLSALIVAIVLLACGNAHATIDSLWSSPATVGAKGGLSLPGSSRIDYLYALDSAASVCHVYNASNFAEAYSFPLACGTYTYLWYNYLDDASGNGDPEVIVYSYSTATYCYSVKIVDMGVGAVVKSWSSPSYSYFPKFVSLLFGSTTLKLGIEKSTGVASGFPSVLLVYSLGITGAVASAHSDPPPAHGIVLEQSFPNPASDRAVIEFTLPRAGHASIMIYNQLGQEVRTLVDGELAAGKHVVRFNAAGLANGAYFYRLRTQDGQDTKRLLLVK